MANPLARTLRTHVVVAALLGAAAVMTSALPHAAQERNRPRNGSQFGGHDVVPGEALVKFRAGYNEMNVASVEAEADADPAERVGGRIHRLRSRSKGVTELIAVL